MRLAEFYRCVEAEFGKIKGDWLVHSHVIEGHNATAAELLERGVEPREIWWGLCSDHDVPEDRWYGPDESQP